MSDPAKPGVAGAGDTGPAPDALADAALDAASGGQAASGLGGGPANRQFFKRDNKWAQEGVDHNVGLLRGHQSGLPDNATNGAHAGVTGGISPSAYAGAGASHTFQGPGGVSGTTEADAYGHAYAGPTGAGAGAGVHAGITIHVNNNLSFGNSVYAAGSAAAGLGPKGLNANAQAGAGYESHIDAGVKGRLGDGVDGATNTHIESGIKAEAGARASVGLDNKVGASGFAGDYLSAEQSGKLSAGGASVEGSAGVISPGSAGVGTHIGGGLDHGDIKVNIGGAGAIGIGGAKFDVTLTIPTKPIVDAAKTEGDAFKWAGEGVAHGVTQGANVVAGGLTQAGHGVADGTTQAANAVAHGVTDAANKIADGFTSAFFGNRSGHVSREQAERIEERAERNVSPRYR